nr:MAG TPA_asm: hypothetical protein [Bacteriophage sp.]
MISCESICDYFRRVFGLLHKCSCINQRES